MGGQSYPKPTAQERQLQSEQAMMLRQQRDMMEEQNRRYDLLAPLMYQQAGLTPQYNESGQITGFTHTPTAEEQYFQEQLGASRQQLTEQNLLRPYLLRQMGLTPQYNEQGVMTGFTETPTAEQQYFQEQMGANREQLRVQQLLQPMLYQSMGLVPQYGEGGKITGFSRDPEQERLQNLNEEVSLQFADRTLKALKGELPVDPTLERTLTTQRGTLGESLRQELGPGYETSTPGMQRLAEFDKRAEELRYAARRDQMTLGQQLGVARETGTQAANSARVGDMLRGSTLGSSNPYMPGSPGGTVGQLMSSYAPIGLYGQGSTAGVLGRLGGVVSAPYTSGGSLGQLAGQFGALLGPYQQERQQQYASMLRNRGMNTQIGTGIGALIGGAAGLYFGGPGGAMAGSSLGGAVGGLGGYYL